MHRRRPTCLSTPMRPFWTTCPFQQHCSKVKSYPQPSFSVLRILRVPTLVSLKSNKTPKAETLLEKSSLLGPARSNCHPRMSSIKHDFFFLWLGRKCTRLGPYNCVSGEKKVKRTQSGQVWQILSQQKQQRQKHQRPANPPARFAFRCKSNSKPHQKRGRAQQKHPHNWIAMQILLLVNSIDIKNMQPNYPAAGQP